MQENQFNCEQIDAEEAYIGEILGPIVDMITD
jgi:hypothetical protein